MAEPVDEDRKRNAPAIRLLFWNLRESLFLNNFDVFQVYKIEARNEGGPRKFYDFLYCEPSLRLEQSRDDEKRQFLGKLVSLFFSYLLIKSIIIVSIEYTLLYATAHLQHQPHLQSTLEWASRLLGAPLSGLQGASIFIAGAISSVAFTFIVVMPYYYSRTALDLAVVRLFLDPTRELRRIRLMIQLRAKTILGSLVVFKHRKIEEMTLWGDVNKSSSSSYSVSDSRALVWTLMEQNRRVLDKLNRGIEGADKSIIPNYYHQQELDLSKLEASRNTSMIYSVFLFWWLLTIVGVLACAVGSKCQQLHLGTHCDLLRVFTWSDALYLLELIVAALSICLSNIMHLNLLVLLWSSQLKLISGIRKELVQCLCVLRRSNAQALVYNYRPITRELTVDQVLLESAIKILVSADELQRATRTMEGLLFPIMNTAFILVALSLLVGDLGSSNGHNLIKEIVLHTGWLVMNCCCWLCANVVSKFQQLDRIYWSVTAELMVRRQKRLGPDMLDFISVTWHKLSSYTRSTDHLYVARPFFISMTYRRVIELNFTIISIISFLYLKP